jgi:hypothetical protein
VFLVHLAVQNHQLYPEHLEILEFLEDPEFLENCLKVPEFLENCLMDLEHLVIPDFLVDLENLEFLENYLMVPEHLEFLEYLELKHLVKEPKIFFLHIHLLQLESNAQQVLVLQMAKDLFQQKTPQH